VPFFSTNAAVTGLDSNPALHSERSPTDRLNHDTAPDMVWIKDPVVGQSIMYEQERYPKLLFWGEVFGKIIKIIIIIIFVNFFPSLVRMFYFHRFLFFTIVDCLKFLQSRF
jgi:hypothetical protein